MGRISTAKRETIIKEILKRKFEDRSAALEEKCKKEVVRHIKRMQEGIPFKACEGYIRLTSSAYVYREGVTSKERKRGEFDIRLDTPVPYLAKGYSSWIFSPVGKDVWESLVREKEELSDEMEKAEEILWAVLESCNTEKQLFETLPSVEPIFADLFKKRENVSLVAVETVQKANALLEGIR